MSILSIWLPLILHYHVPGIKVTEGMINTARQAPDDSVLDEIKGFFEPLDFEVITDTEQILQGKFVVKDGPTIPIGFPFDPDDLIKRVPDWPIWPVFVAGFGIPDELLRAYEVTGRDDLLMAAKDIITAFASYERNAWLPKGLLWNDHAVADRISVIARFWKHYRRHPDFQIRVAEDVFQLIARSAQLLTKPGHFTFATNHGIMQNLALLQLYLAFPTLPGVDHYKTRALERLHDQIAFYVNSEGVVLEHSAGYHRAGVEFMGMAFRYLTLMNLPIPEEWRVKYRNAIDFYSQLRRPDGTLPLFGDTEPIEDPSGPFVASMDADGKCRDLEYRENWIPNQQDSTYPIAGYSIDWGGLDQWPDEDGLNQTVVIWSRFPGHAHKHADEMGVLFWANGLSWWTNSGYWPYDLRGRAEALSWAGSNAPHLSGEEFKSDRKTRLISYGSSDAFYVVDLQRSGPDNYTARRQVVHLKPDLWFIVDYTEGNAGTTTITTWTTSPGIRIESGDFEGSFILEAENSNTVLTKYILAPAAAEITRHGPGFDPFTGWVQGEPSSSIVISQPADKSWSAAIWSLHASDGEGRRFAVDSPQMVYHKNAEDWKIVLQSIEGQVSVWRRGNRVAADDARKKNAVLREIRLTEAPQVANEIDAIRSKYKYAKQKYPRKNYSIRRYKKATYLLLLFFMAQEAFFFVYNRIDGKHYNKLRILNLIGWMFVGICLFKIAL